MKISAPWIAGVLIALAISFQINLYQNHRIKSLQDLVSLDFKARQIDQDQIRDLMFQLQMANSEKQAASSASFVAGVVDSINRKDYYAEVWHNGFDRGSQNQVMIDQEKKNVLTTVSLEKEESGKK